MEVPQRLTKFLSSVHLHFLDDRLFDRPKLSINSDQIYIDLGCLLWVSEPYELGFILYWQLQEVLSHCFYGFYYFRGGKLYIRKIQGNGNIV